MRWPTRKDAWPGAGAPRLRWLLLLCASLLVVLAGCASASSTSAQVTATPCIPPTPVGGTGTCAPIVITTDRAVYAPLDAIHVTITNLLPHSGNNHVLLILTGVRGCPLAQIQRLQGSVWEDVPVCLTPAGAGQGGGTSTAGARQMTVPEGGQYDELIAAGNGPADPVHRQPFPTGLYQLVVHYTLVATTSVASVTLNGEVGGDSFVALSQPFRVCTSGVCS